MFDKINNSNLTRRLFLLGVVILMGMVFCFADDSISLGEYSFVESNTKFKFPNATITVSDTNTKFYSMTVSVNVGSIDSSSCTNIKSGDSVLTDLNYRTATWTYSNTGYSIEELQNKLKSIVFNYVSGMKVTVEISSRYTNLPSDLNLTSATFGSKKHYYGFVSTSISWTAAYNAAKSLYFEGLRGYLVTITCAEEDTILDNITTAIGWAGGARVVKSSTTTFDGATTSLTYPGNNRTDTSLETMWKWVCGPEAGTLIKTPYATDGSKISDTYTVEYSHWSSGEPNDYQSTKEWVLEVHHGNNHLWNDYPTNEEVAGYFVEFSDYNGGKHSSYNNGKTLNVTSGTIDPSAHNHNWTITYDPSTKKYTATCSGSGTCPLGNTLTLGVDIVVENK